MTKSQRFGTLIGNSIGYAAGAAATSIVETSGSLATGLTNGYDAGRAGASWAELRALANNAPKLETPARGAAIKTGKARAAA